MGFQTRWCVSCGWFLSCLFALQPLDVGADDGNQDAWRSIHLKSSIDAVAPWTGIVLWTDHEKNQFDAIQLEYSYVGYDECVDERGALDWTGLDRLLDQVAKRQHQAILRFHFVYPGRNTTVPAFIKDLPDYRETRANSEGKATSFVDWSNRTIQKFVLDFYSAFAERYDDDPRIAYVQTGFGLWAEYHIYSGPRKLGKTFPAKTFQTRFLNHLDQVFEQTPWMISVDAADGQYSPFENDSRLLGLRFGLFDDSFLCKPHARENALNWRYFGSNRWTHSPGGGEFSYYNRRDQKLALADTGPNGRSFEDMAEEFHVTFMIGNDQPQYQSIDRIREAGMAIGYRLRITRFESSATASRITVSNVGIAPPYHDAYVTVNDVRATQSLRGLLPGDHRSFEIPSAGQSPRLTIESDRLVNGQEIPYEANLN